MALIEFKNKPNTTTPINANNLNHNFKELDERTNYSTEEQVVGTWIDGKPIYRKIVQFTIGAINTANQHSLGLTAETIVGWKGYFKNNDNQYWPIDNFYTDSNGTNGIWVFVDAKNGILYEQHNYSYPNGKKAFITIDYTKTTD